jgi:hypothetical protein
MHTAEAIMQMRKSERVIANSFMIKYKYKVIRLDSIFIRFSVLADRSSLIGTAILFFIPTKERKTTVSMLWL